jgi:hypothetical protein
VASTSVLGAGCRVAVGEGARGEVLGAVVVPAPEPVRLAGRGVNVAVGRLITGELIGTVAVAGWRAGLVDAWLGAVSAATASAVGTSVARAESTTTSRLEARKRVDPTSPLTDIGTYPGSSMSASNAVMAV